MLKKILALVFIVLNVFVIFLGIFISLEFLWIPIGFILIASIYYRNQ